MRNISLENFRRGFILEYILWILFGLLFLILAKTAPQIFANPWFFSMAFLYLLLLPGWLLFGILKIKIEDFAGLFLCYLTLGLIFYLILALLAVLAALSLAALIKISFGLLILLFVLGFLLALFRPAKTPTLPKKITEADLFLLLPIIFGAFILYVVYLKGPGLDGDPYLHLSIIRKAFLGDSLSPRALAFAKTGLIMPAYNYPIWHVFLAFLSKILSLDPLIVWSNVLFALTAIMLFIWYWFFKKIFVQKGWSILALLIFLAVTFYVGTGYLFTRLAVPDTLAQFILLPLLIALSLDYIFAQNQNRSLLVIISLLAIISLIIHGPHYFYFLFIFLIFGLLYTIVGLKDNAYKIILKKIGEVIFISLIPLVLFGIIVEALSGSLSMILAEFSKASPQN